MFPVAAGGVDCKDLCSPRLVSGRSLVDHLGKRDLVLAGERENVVERRSQIPPDRAVRQDGYVDGLKVVVDQEAAFAERQAQCLLARREGLNVPQGALLGIESIE
jgi:hypothetical protein